MRLFASVLTLTLLLAAATPAWAGGGPENVFLVVNSRGAKSKEVANLYISLRHIPPNNVIYLPAPPEAKIMTGLDFREKLLRPIFAEIAKRGLNSQIDYIVYSCDFPWKIDFSGMLKIPDSGSPTRPTASLTGATYLYQFVEQADVNLPQLNTNFYCIAADMGPETTRAFRSDYQWKPGGARVLQGGLNYMLSAELGCSQPEANTVEEMKRYLTLSAAADGTRPDGTFYYTQNSDIRSTVRQDGYPEAVRQLQALGLKAKIASGVVPPPGSTLLGLTTGSTNVRLNGTRDRFAAGALVDNLTSQGAVFIFATDPQKELNHQTRISEYLRLGVGGASGTVIEPYAIPQKFPLPSVHVHYARGSSMAEAFYQSVQGPYQLLILGDPLCQPWALIPKVAVEGVTDGATLSGTVEITPTATLYGKRTVNRFEFYVDGAAQVPTQPGETIKLDTTELADGYHELRVVAIDDTPIETQGRWIGQVKVANGAEAVSLTSPAGKSVTGRLVVLNVASTVEGETAVHQNGREVGRVQGKQGVLSVPVEQVGLGTVTFSARTLGETALRSESLTLEIH